MADNLSKIDYLVVLMLENRSFDHMLGYLKMEKKRKDILGLTGNESNSYNAEKYNPFKLKTFKFKDDPYHHWKDVKQQVSDNNGGFVKNFAKVKRKVQKPEDVMGYHNDKDLPVFNFFAENYCICNRWFSSVPGPTQPNRAYAISGTSEGNKDNIFPPKRYKSKTVFNYLDDFGVSWKYYSHDIAFLRLNDNFTLSADPIAKFDSFVEAVRDGNLPSVSWIDPDFGTIPWPVDWGHDNDDHPPHDVRQGQRLVAKIYNLLLHAKNDLWNRTLFIVTYDEHGGFYDHHVPPRAKDNYKAFRQYGVRVPAFVISPWAKRKSVSNLIFDHTSIVKTILLRFCNKGNGSIPNMGQRVKFANDLGPLLVEKTPRTDCKPSPTVRIKGEILTLKSRMEELEKPSELQKDLMELRALCLSQGLMDKEL
jgi:phospholipase C